MPNQPYKLIDQPVLTFVARQKGEAWNHPFVCVYEPSSDTEPGDIASVDYFMPRNMAPPTADISATTSVVRMGCTTPASRVMEPCTSSTGMQAKMAPGPRAAEKARLLSLRRS